MLSHFDLSTKAITRWSIALGFFEVIALIRYFKLDEPITEICPMLGPNPSSHLIHAYLLVIGVLAYIRFSFAVRPTNPGLAKFAFQAHTLEVVPVTALYWTNLISTISSVEDFSTNKKLLPAIFIYFVILANAIIFWRFYERVCREFIAAGDKNLLKGASVSLTREGSVASILDEEVAFVRASAAVKKTTSTSNSRKSGSKK
jgi:hypothetical protein